MAIKKNNSVKEVPHKTSALQFIRTVYLSIAAIIGMVMFLIGASGGIRLVLNNYVWHTDQYINYYGYETGVCPKTRNMGIDGKTVVTMTDEEVKDCERKTEEANKKNNEKQNKRELADSIALAVVGLPVWLFHFRVMQNDWKKRNQKA